MEKNNLYFWSAFWLDDLSILEFGVSMDRFASFIINMIYIGSPCMYKDGKIGQT